MARIRGKELQEAAIARLGARHAAGRAVRDAHGLDRGGHVEIHALEGDAVVAGEDVVGGALRVGGLGGRDGVDGLGDGGGGGEGGG